MAHVDRYHRTEVLDDGRKFKHLTFKLINDLTNERADALMNEYRGKGWECMGTNVVQAIGRMVTYVRFRKQKGIT